MPKSIQISRQITAWSPRLQAYKLVVEAVNPKDMPPEVFIKQRMRNFAQNSFDDNFVGVCTPDQLEDFPVNSPNQDSSFYRVAKIELINRLPEAIDAIFDSLLYEVQKLVEDLNSLEVLEEANLYNVEPERTTWLTSSFTSVDGGRAPTIFGVDNPNLDGGATGP